MRAAKIAPLFATGVESDRNGSPWRNKLIWGDNKYVAASLLDGDAATGLEAIAGKIDLVYIDPPFATGADFSMLIEVGDSSVLKQPTAIEEVAYRDTWQAGPASYLQMMLDRLTLISDLLSPTGTLYLHCDWRMQAALRLVLDEVFGPEKFRAEIIWQKLRSVKSQALHFANMHDSVLVYSRSDEVTFNPQFVAKNPELLNTHYRHTEEQTGRRYNLDNFTQVGQGPPRRFGDQVLDPPPGKHWIWSQERIDVAMAERRIVFSSGGVPYVKRYFDDNEGTRVGDIWVDVNPVNQVANERLDFPTQKPEALLDRIIRASSQPGDLVADFFVGSGTTAAVAEQLGRRWIGCDLGRFAIHTTRKRLLSVAGCQPFEVLNLGRYQRRYWQGCTQERRCTSTSDSS